jgi:hypothetical protein
MINDVGDGDDNFQFLPQSSRSNASKRSSLNASASNIKGNGRLFNLERNFHVYICIYIHTYICICIYIYTYILHLLVLKVTEDYLILINFCTFLIITK